MVKRIGTEISDNDRDRALLVLIDKGLNKAFTTSGVSNIGDWIAQNRALIDATAKDTTWNILPAEESL